VYGDRYAGEWPPEQFARNGISYEPSELNKSEIYLAFLPMLNSRTVALLTNDRLQRQLLSLERSPSRAGRDIIDHPRHGKDDVANAVAGCMVMLQHALRLLKHWHHAPVIEVAEGVRKISQPPGCRRRTGCLQKASGLDQRDDVGSSLILRRLRRGRKNPIKLV
jgi:hypothetical protein